MHLVGQVQTIRFNEIERDPGVATFKCTAGFDFTLCAFHTRPTGNPLRKELEFLDNLFDHVQNLDSAENDIIFVGDFNAPPTPIPTQTIAILDSMGSTVVNFRFAITSKPTNLLQTKIFDNIFFDRAQTVEFVNGPQHVVPMFDMIDDFDEPITADDQLDWFRENVADHCPIYAVFRADRDTD